MKGTSSSSWRTRVSRTLPIFAVGVASLGAMLVGQIARCQPQPQPDKLHQFPCRPVKCRPRTKAEGVMPTVPAGFTVSSYAELAALRA